MILQLNPPWWVITPKGKGKAKLVIDYGPDDNTVYVVELDDTREHIHVDSSELLGTENAMYDLRDGIQNGRRVK